jgi:hypothetical protein
VREKNALLSDGKEAVAEPLIRQNVIDTQVDLISMLLHSSSFAQIAKKASLLAGGKIFDLPLPG